MLGNKVNFKKAKIPSKKKLNGKYCFLEPVNSKKHSKDLFKNFSLDKKGIVIVPVAFVSEHSETLVELDIEYKKLAEKNGCSFYKRVPALGIEENFIKGLTELVLQKETRRNFVSSVMCPNKYVQCPCL